MLLLWSEKEKGDEIFVDAHVHDLSVGTACSIVRMSPVCVCRGEKKGTILIGLE